MLYIKLSLLICSLIVILRNIYFVLTLFQQEHYDYKKLLKILPFFYLNKKYNYVILLLILISIIDNIYLYILGMTISILIIFIKEHFIQKLKVTKRILRLIITYMFFLIILFIIVNKNYHLELYYLVFLISPFIIILSNFINYPIELMIKTYYKNKAKSCLKESSNLIKIAITGSYGKTSTKNILTKILEKKYITLASPKSYNTLMGISKVINRDLNTSCEVLILELGAYRKGEIKEMTKLIDPHIGIITDVGYQHIETFKTIDNVLKAKTELIDYMNDSSVCIINGDNQYLRNKEYRLEPLFYGLLDNNKICAKNIKINNGEMSFDIYYEENFQINIQTYLLGIHNIKNILACFGIVQKLKNYNIEISNLEFKDSLLSIKPIKHRLSYEFVRNIHIYDDSYNSNIVGFQNSIEVIKQINLKKILITPGIVDCGKMTKELNEKIAVEIEDVFDEVYIIDNYSGRFIYNALDKCNKNLFVSFKEAFNEVLNKYINEEICLLIENDLPDNFLYRRKFK